MIPRILEQSIRERLGRKKAILLLGPRQTGKTTLVKKILVEQPGEALYLNGDDPTIRVLLNEPNTERLRQITAGYDLIIVDEAQRIKNIGITLKIVIDQMPEKQVIATGSSSLELANEINEPLTGRKFELNIYPVSWREWSDFKGFVNARTGLENRLLYGMYPDVLMNPGHEKEILANLVSSYLYKDLLSFGAIRKPELLEKLLRALAFQVGGEVSFNELSNLLQVDKNTVSNYISLLEQTFVIFRLTPFSRNLRQEITSTRKIYFYDNGVLNALIGNFNALELRQDKGALWENFLVSERKKKNQYTQNWFARSFFWRTVSGSEIDYLEEQDGRITAYEFKWNIKKKGAPPRAFREKYPEVDYTVINPDNFDPFL